MPGDRRDQHCIASQAVRASARAFRGPWKRPQTADLRALAFGLNLPIWPFWQVKSSRVSRRLQKCSRFRETAAGDLVRSRLPGEGGSSSACGLASWSASLSPKADRGLHRHRGQAAGHQPATGCQARQGNGQGQSRHWPRRQARQAARADPSNSITWTTSIAHRNQSWPVRPCQLC